MRTGRVVLRALALAALAALPACAGTTTPDGARSAELAFLLLTPPGNVIGTISVEVTGPGIDTALVFNLTISGSTASGTARVPAGSARRVVARAFDGSGVSTHRGDTTVTLVEGANPSVTLTLQPLVGTLPLTLTFGTTVVAASGADASLAVNATIQFTATAANWRGVTVPADSIRWATSNAGLASVSATGLVTALSVGAADIVATYEGAAARRRVTVTP